MNACFVFCKCLGLCLFALSLVALRSAVFTAIDAHDKWRDAAEVQKKELAAVIRETCDVISSPRLRPVPCEAGKKINVDRKDPCFVVEVPVYIASGDVFAMARKYRSIQYSITKDEEAARTWAKGFSDSSKVDCYQFLDDVDRIKLDGGHPVMPQQEALSHRLILSGVRGIASVCLAFCAGILMMLPRSSSNSRVSDSGEENETEELLG
eukprot:TRINITY_DN25545_c0_g1_i1.p1 TRINITY_DN25545_c0_g1~~TRINITY_DN25545_c0_g1_i1.p1  ORF type:complete len:209 (+),score=36.98 TRINITY_DN25545_c0_g1_i1:58-684(+)